MSTAQRQIAVPKIYDGSVARSQGVSGHKGVDPRRRRYGYHPGLYRMEVEPQHSGQQSAVIPGGILVPFRTATLGVENFDINVPMDEYRKQVERDMTAKYFIDNCKVNYESQGFRELEPLTMLDDVTREEDGRILFETFRNSPHGYFNQVHPIFEEVKWLCPYNLVNCATCRTNLLGGDSGEVPEVIQRRIDECPDPEIAENLRLALFDANLTYRDWCRQKWQVVIGEYDDKQKGEPGIGRFDDSLHHIRKNIHEVAPTERTALAAASYGAQVAEGQAEGMKELANAFRESKQSNNSDLIAMLAKGQEQQGKMLAQLGKAVEVLAQNVAGQPEKSEKATKKGASKPAEEETAATDAPE